MSRPLKAIQEELRRCKAQIAATFDNETPDNKPDMAITREGFQKQLKTLNNELSQHTRNLRVINPRIVQPNGSEPLFI